MKILSITAQKPDSTGSGVYLTELVKGFLKLGHEQAVITGITNKDHVQMPEEMDVFPVYYQTAKLPFPIVGMSDEMPYESTRYCDMTDSMTQQYRTAFADKIQEVIEKFQPDVILCHHLYYLAALVRELCPNIKVYGISHGSDLRQIQKNSWQREYIKQYICQLDHIFALHREQKYDICKYYGCKEEKIEVIGTGYNSDVFFQQSWKVKENKKLRLIFAGKISEKKGVMSLIRSIDYIPDAANKIEIAIAGGYGNAKEYENIIQLAESCSCRVKFLGKLSQKALAEELNKSDIFILPSFFEGLPLVIIEAMACGLHVVCTDLPGIQNWLEENIPGNGVQFVKPPQMHNADEPIPETLPIFERRLAEAIQKVQTNPLPKQELIKKISWDGLCEKLNQYFREVM